MSEEKEHIWTIEEMQKMNDLPDKDRRRIMIYTSRRLINMFNATADSLDVPPNVLKVACYIAHRAMYQSLEQHLTEVDKVKGAHMDILNANADLLSDFWLKRASEVEELIRQELGVEDLKKCDPVEVHKAWTRVVAGLVKEKKEGGAE